MHIAKTRNGEDLYEGNFVKWLEDITHDGIFTYCTARVCLKNEKVIFEEAVHHRADGLRVNFDMDEKYKKDGYTPAELLEYCEIAQEWEHLEGE